MVVVVSVAAVAAVLMVYNGASNCYSVIGSSVKTSRGRIQLNCGPMSSVRTLSTSCPEYLVRYLLARFIHVLRGARCFVVFLFFGVILLASHLVLIISQ